jgi:two-component sensor histidine kinase
LLADGDEFGALLSDIRSRGVSLGREFLVYKADGSTIWLSVNAWRVRSASGQGFDIDCLATDIDARKRSELQLRATLEQKELLLREVHHRVKNNLQILVSLLELEETQAHAAKELAILGEFSSRILAMGKIHGLVYTSRDLNSVDMMAYADSILAELHAKYHGCFGKVEWRIEGDRLLLNLDQAIPCGLMLREILSNSLRHAFPTPRVSTGAILVRFGTSADGRTELTISDDGTGLPHGFEASVSDGLGIMLIHSLASQLHAEISFDGSAGCRYTVMFPSEPIGPGPGVTDTT